MRRRGSARGGGGEHEVAGAGEALRGGAGEVSGAGRGGGERGRGGGAAVRARWWPAGERAGGSVHARVDVRSIEKMTKCRSRAV